MKIENLNVQRPSDEAVQYALRLAQSLGVSRAALKEARPWQPVPSRG